MWALYQVPVMALEHPVENRQTNLGTTTSSGKTVTTHCRALKRFRDAAKPLLCALRPPRWKNVPDSASFIHHGQDHLARQVFIQVLAAGCGFSEVDGHQAAQGRRSAHQGGFLGSGFLGKKAQGWQILNKAETLGLVSGATGFGKQPLNL